MIMNSVFSPSLHAAKWTLDSRLASYSSEISQKSKLVVLIVITAPFDCEPHLK